MQLLDVKLLHYLKYANTTWKRKIEEFDEISKPISNS